MECLVDSASLAPTPSPRARCLRRLCRSCGCVAPSRQPRACSLVSRCRPRRTRHTDRTRQCTWTQPNPSIHMFLYVYSFYHFLSCSLFAFVGSRMRTHSSRHKYLTMMHFHDRFLMRLSFVSDAQRSCFFLLVRVRNLVTLACCRGAVTSM